LVEVRAMIAAITLGDVHDVFQGRSVTIIAAIDMEARRVEMHIRRTQSQTLGGRGRNETVEFGHSIGIERIQGPTEGVIIELVGSHAR
jgi:hypothetical protein